MTTLQECPCCGSALGFVVTPQGVRVKVYCVECRVVPPQRRL